MSFPTLYLASNSPRRAQLLEQIDITFTPLLANSTEDVESLEALVGREEAHTYVQRVTLLKLHAAVERMQRRRLATAPILCADTTVSIGSSILGKPQNSDDAHAMLRILSGKQHHVHTCVAIYHEGVISKALSTSTVYFKPLCDAEIEAYIVSQEPFGKAGSYAIQGQAAKFIERIEGSYTGIMGLPLFETAQLIDNLSTS